MEKKMEPTREYIGGYIGVMEKNMVTSVTRVTVITT